MIQATDFVTKKKLIVAITGASGSIYADILLKKLRLLQENIESLGIVFSGNAKDVWKYELEKEIPDFAPFKVYAKDDFFAPFASGSAGFDTMIICPCSMGTLSRIATGISNDLITRAADVILKERRKLILVPRETPLNAIHINNMKTLTDVGGIICPATPSFYSRPKTLEQVAETVVDRVLSLAGFDIKSFRWSEENI